jgi:glycosyltransferase involved in cell wall biosynthesis
MKVAFVSHPGYTVLPPAGSVEIGTREMARRMAGRHDLTVIASATPKTRDTTDAGIRYRFIDHGRDAGLARFTRPLHRLPFVKTGYFASLLNPLIYWVKVALEIRRGGYDVVHIANLTQALPIIRRLNPRVRLVLHMHCEWLAQLDRGMLARRLRHADVILGVSDHITDPIRRRFPQFADRCRTVYNGVEVGAPPGPRSAGEHVTLLHVGRISPEKGHHVLVEALNDVVRDHPELRLVLVGEEAVIPLDWAVGISADPMISDLERFYGSSYLEQVKVLMSPELAERVEFTGRIEYDEAMQRYRRADLFVFPSFFESMGMPPVEAMAAGLPVVSSAVGGVVEIVQDGTTGVFVERGDPEALARALRDLIEDPERRARLGAAGYARAVEHFAWDRVTDSFELALEGALEVPRSRRMRGSAVPTTAY